MATKASTEAANELSVALMNMDFARTIARLAKKSGSLSPEDAAEAFSQLLVLLDDVHNQVDCVREGLEA